MAPMGVSPPIGLTNHGGVEALELLCARCGGLLISLCTEVVGGRGLLDFAKLRHLGKHLGELDAGLSTHKVGSQAAGTEGGRPDVY